MTASYYQCHNKPIMINISIFKPKIFIIFYSCFVVFVLSAPVTFVVHRTTLLDQHVSVSQQLFDLFRLCLLLRSWKSCARNSFLLLHLSFREWGLLHLRSSSVCFFLLNESNLFIFYISFTKTDKLCTKTQEASLNILTNS